MSAVPGSMAAARIAEAGRVGAAAGRGAGRAARREAWRRGRAGLMVAGAVIVGGAWAAGSVAAPGPVLTTEAAAGPLWAAVPVCVDDGGTGAPCYWPAGTAGNGHGSPFYVDADGVTHYPGAVVTVGGRAFTVPGLPASS